MCKMRCKQMEFSYIPKMCEIEKTVEQTQTVAGKWNLNIVQSGIFFSIMWIIYSLFVFNNV